MQTAKEFGTARKEPQPRSDDSRKASRYSTEGKQMAPPESKDAAPQWDEV